MIQEVCECGGITEFYKKEKGIILIKCSSCGDIFEKGEDKED